MQKLRRMPAALWLAALIAVVAAPVAAIGAGEGDPLRGGVRNPSPNTTLELRGETEIIAENDTYGTRQSNKGTGGGAIYGCRSAAGGTLAGNEPCIRANNLSQGFAFEFETDGGLGGLITVGDGGDKTSPFSTNATGIASGLNADYVDGQELDAAAVAADGTLQARTQDQTSASRTGPGTYQVDFPVPSGRSCYFQASVRNGPAFIAVTGAADPPGRALVTTHAPDGSPADVPFYVTAQCAAAHASTTG